MHSNYECRIKTRLRDMDLPEGGISKIVNIPEVIELVLGRPNERQAREYSDLTTSF